MSPIAVAVQAPPVVTPPVVTPPTTTPGSPSIPAYSYPRERWQWLSPRGQTRELTQFVDGAEVIKGMNGRYSPPLTTQTIVVPTQPGAVLTDLRHDVREIDVPLMAKGNDVPSLQLLLKEMASDFNCVTGPGTLRRINVDGTYADLFCYCMTGINGTNEGNTGPTAHVETLIFQAYDPYWYQQPISVNFIQSGSPSIFPILPLRLGIDNVLGDISFTNVGDVATWPTWTINGPATSFELTNNGTTETISMNQPLLAGQQLVIVTKPGFGSVVGPDGSNWRKYLTSRAMWSIAPGLNDLSVTLQDTTDQSYVNLTYRPATLAP